MIYFEGMTVTEDGSLALVSPPDKWTRCGRALERGDQGAFDSSVTGDPCIVWDDARACHHMFYFAQRHQDGREINSVGHAITGPGGDALCWNKLGPVHYRNPEDLAGDTHKPWILMDAYRPNVPVKLNGYYWLFSVSYRGRNKVVQRARSDSLDGPWEVIPGATIDTGPASAFDGYHADCISAYWFEHRGEILLFYTGYPLQPQLEQPHSPFGASCAAAVMRPGDPVARKLGRVLEPSVNPSHWTSGYIGGVQILPATGGGWYAILNASPTPPAPVAQQPAMREPAPSLGGWAYTSEEWPVSGWRAFDDPIEWIEDIPEDARLAGEGVNLWRHHVLLGLDGRLYLLYNSGEYGQESMFVRAQM